MSAERCPGTCGLPPVPRSAPPSLGEGGDSGTGRAALARGGGPGAGRRAVPVGRATKNGEAVGVGEVRDPAAGAGAGPGAGSDHGAAAVGERWLPAVGGQQRRAGRGAPCLPRAPLPGRGIRGEVTTRNDSAWQRLRARRRRRSGERRAEALCVYKRCSASPSVVYLVLLLRKRVSCNEFSLRFLLTVL